MARFWTLFLSAATCITAVAGEDVLVSERHKLSKRFIDAQGNYNISFYHVNDVHSHLDEFNSNGLACNRTIQECVGGYSRIRTLVNQGRKVHQDSLFLNVGDEFQGTLFFSYYGGGSKIAETLNVMGFDAMTLGNHEFDQGPKHLGEFLTNISSIPIISANIHSTDPVLNKTIKPYKIFDEYQLAVIGVTTDQTPSISQPGDETTFSDPIKAVQDTVDHIRETTNIKRIAAITHIGYEEDKRLARETTGLYLIMGGHSHTLLGNAAGAEGAYPTILKNKEEQEVFIVTAHRWGEHLGYIDVTYDPEGRILAYHGAPVRLTNATKQDPELQELVDEWKKPFIELANEVVGNTTVVLDHTLCKTSECVLGNVITDAMYEFREADAKAKNLPPPAFAFTNGGGVRATLDEGNITRGHVLTAFPFSNAVVEFDLTGQEVWDLFEGVLKRVNKNDTTKTVTSFVQVSSQIRARWTPTNATVNPNIGTLTSLNISGEPVDLQKTYKVVSIDFLANGGDNILIPKKTAYALDPLDDVLIKYLQKFSPITAGIEGRLSHELPSNPPKCKKRRRGVKKTVNAQ